MRNRPEIRIALNMAIRQWNLTLWTVDKKAFFLIRLINFQLMHTTLKNVELLQHFKISKTAPTCFGLQGNHHQRAAIST